MSIHPECAQWQERSEQVLAGGPGTLSKMPSRYPIPIAPSVLMRGDGPYVFCPDGIKYLDCVAGLGPVILGHNAPAVSLAVMEQADALACSTLSTPLECEVAEMLCSIIPGAEQSRFACNGKDITEAAVKLARYVTGKRHVVYCGYSGGYPDYLITTDKHGGLLPSLSNWNHQVAWRDFNGLNALFHETHTYQFIDTDLAAIILEVPPETQETSRESTAETLRYYSGMAKKYGAVFILDEIVTGLRYGLGGAQAYYGIQADLITMSKALGNGYPISVILGQKDLMSGFNNGTVFLSTTFGASPIGLAAAKATLLELQGRHGLTQLQEHGEALRIMFQRVLTNYSIPLPVSMRGNYARLVFDFRDIEGVATASEVRTYWLQEFAKNNILAGVPWLPMCCWDSTIVASIEDTAGCICDAWYAAEVHGIKLALEVPIISDVFSRYEPPRVSA